MQTTLPAEKQERLKIRNKGVSLYMMSLPRSSPGFTSTNPQGDTSFHPGINLSNTPFRQFAHDGFSKREFMPHRSSNPHESVSDEIQLLNYNNYQQQLTGENLDDIASDILLLKQKLKQKRSTLPC